MRTHTYTYVRIRTQAGAHVSSFTWLMMRMHAHTCTYVRIHTQAGAHVSSFTWLMMRMHAHTCTYVRIHTQAGAHVSSFTWLMMAVFGITVVLLLLNLLIARFSKTFDMIYENVDANFKVAFARVVLKGAGQELVPPPFNLIRLAVLMVYSLLDLASGWCCAWCCEGVYDRLLQLAGSGRARLLNCINANTRTPAGGSPMQLHRRGTNPNPNPNPNRWRLSDAAPPARYQTSG